MEAQTKTVGEAQPDQGPKSTESRGSREEAREGQRLVCPSYMDGSQPVWGIADKFSEIKAALPLVRFSPREPCLPVKANLCGCSEDPARCSLSALPPRRIKQNIQR